MTEKKKRKEILTLALLVGVLPPIWAVASPYLGNQFGPIALICAGIYAANGNRFSDAGRILLGYLMGDIWALITAIVVERSIFNIDITLFIVLFIMGAVAVVISSKQPRIFFLPSWLSGWAIGMLTMNLYSEGSLYHTTVKIGAAMLVGVYYVGALLDCMHKALNK